MSHTINPPKDRKKEIINAAKKRFIRYGYEQTNMEHVAKTLGVSKGVVYFHFKSKSEIFDIAICEMFDERLSELIEIMGDARFNSLEKLRMIFSEYKQKPFDISPPVISVYSTDESHELFYRMAADKIAEFTLSFEKLITEGCEGDYFDCPDPALATRFCFAGEAAIKSDYSGRVGDLIDKTEEMYLRILGVKNV
jgi:AcrR family transcriptional regulator